MTPFDEAVNRVVARVATTYPKHVMRMGGVREWWLWSKLPDNWDDVPTPWGPREDGLDGDWPAAYAWNRGASYHALMQMYGPNTGRRLLGSRRATQAEDVKPLLYGEGY